MKRDPKKVRSTLNVVLALLIVNLVLALLLPLVYLSFRYEQAPIFCLGTIFSFALMFINAILVISSGVMMIRCRNGVKDLRITALVAGIMLFVSMAILPVYMLNSLSPLIVLAGVSLFMHNLLTWKRRVPLYIGCLAAALTYPAVVSLLFLNVVLPGIMFDITAPLFLSLPIVSVVLLLVSLYFSFETVDLDISRYAPGSEPFDIKRETSEDLIPSPPLWMAGTDIYPLPRPRKVSLYPPPGWVLG